MDGYLSLVREIASLDPPAYVFGGIAEELLLEGRISDSHADLDLLVPSEQGDQTQAQLTALGFSDFAVHHEPLPGRPLVLGRWGSPQEPRVPIDAGVEIGYWDTGEEVGDRAHLRH